MEIDYYAHEYLKNPPAEFIEDEGFDLDQVLESMADDDWEPM